MARELFGTDGVRGVAGEKLTAELALALGRAADAGDRRRAPARPGHPRHARVRRDAGGRARRGRDLRRRRRASSAACCRRPAAPLLLGQYGFDLAAVVSASHNPYADNGIKFFAARRLQALRRRTRTAIEERLRAPARRRRTAIGRVRALHGTQEDYLRALQVRFEDLDLAGLDVLLDCAHGATYRVGPEIFRRLGATVTTIGDRARRAQHQRRRRLDPRRRARRAGRRAAGTTSASRSTATATACWPPTAPARSSTATS